MRTECLIPVQSWINTTSSHVTHSLHKHGRIFAGVGNPHGGAKHDPARQNYPKLVTLITHTIDAGVWSHCIQLESGRGFLCWWTYRELWPKSAAEAAALFECSYPAAEAGKKAPINHNTHLLFNNTQPADTDSHLYIYLLVTWGVKKKSYYD